MQHAIKTTLLRQLQYGRMHTTFLTTYSLVLLCTIVIISMLLSMYINKLMYLLILCACTPRVMHLWCFICICNNYYLFLFFCSPSSFPTLFIHLSLPSLFTFLSLLLSFFFLLLPLSSFFPSTSRSVSTFSLLSSYLKELKVRHSITTT